MDKLSVHALPGQNAPAQRLAAQLGAPAHEISVHHFPDGENRVRVHPVAGTAILYGSLDRPNDKLIELILAAAALRENGAAALVLVAPYMCYMRQDTAFHSGEAVSQKVIGGFLADRFDRIITVDPHLHRTPRIDDVFPGTPSMALSAAPLIADLLRHDGAPPTMLIAGPDSEARQWVEAVARPLKLDFIVGEKIRSGDRRVSLTLPDAASAKGRDVVIVDDVISSGSTIVACAEALRQAGAARIDVVTVHALFGRDDFQRMTDAGVARIRSSDSVLHETNGLFLAPLLASSLAAAV